MKGFGIQQSTILNNPSKINPGKAFTSICRDSAFARYSGKTILKRDKCIRVTGDRISQAGIEELGGADNI